jgi:hypothetical protein
MRGTHHQRKISFLWTSTDSTFTQTNQQDRICRNPSLSSRPRQGGCKVAGLQVDPGVISHAPRSAKRVREWTLTLPSELPCWELVRVGVPKGLSKLQRAFWGVKTPWLVALFISMERSWSVDVQNGIALLIWTSETQVMAKRRPGSRTPGSPPVLTPDH